MDLNLLITITGLALADSVNVCAFAVLTMVLVTILIQNPDKKRKVLFAGIAFILAVFVMYFVYGIIIYNILRSLAENIQTISPYIYNSLVVLIMIIGALNIKDYFYYKKGNLATEMPIFMRPKVKKIINKISSPKGAFLTGILVTLFLLPCTIAPLIGTINKLSNLGYTLIESFPWLIYYNIIFVLPMLIIVAIVYFGFSKVEEVSGWKERNIRLLHLIAGILLFLVGVALLLGWL